MSEYYRYNDVPAFPQPCTEGGYPANSPYAAAGGGLSVPEYTAIKILQGIVINQDLKQENRISPENAANLALEYAEALVKKFYG